MSVAVQTVKIISEDEAGSVDPLVLSGVRLLRQLRAVWSSNRPETVAGHLRIRRCRLPKVFERRVPEVSRSSKVYIVAYSAPVRGRAFSVAGRWLGTRYTVSRSALPDIYTFQRHLKTYSICPHSRLCGAGSMKRHGVSPSLCLSRSPAATCGGFAAVGPASRRYRIDRLIACKNPENVCHCDSA